MTSGEKPSPQKPTGRADEGSPPGGDRAPESGDVLSALFDGIDDVIYVADPETYELLLVNESFAQNWGGDVLGQKCHRVLQDRATPCPFCTNDIIFGEKLGETHRWEFQNETNGRWYRCSDKAIRWLDGRLVRFELAADITTIKQTADALEQANAQLAQSNKELEQFAYVASHDLQEPLRMVASYTQLLAQRYEGQLDEKADKFIGYAVDGARRMQNLINDLLAYSRVRTRGEELVPVNTTEVLTDVLQNLERAIDESDAEIVVGELPRVCADGTQLGQVFQNLIGNALKFRGESPPRVEITARAAGELIELAVSDNGIGIEPAFHDRIFIIFQRLHGRDAYAGTGIGLSIVKSIVERHGGRIHIDSAEGQGTTVRFTLPAANRPESKNHG